MFDAYQPSSYAPREASPYRPRKVRGFTTFLMACLMAAGLLVMNAQPARAFTCTHDSILAWSTVGVVLYGDSYASCGPETVVYNRARLQEHAGILGWRNRSTNDWSGSAAWVLTWTTFNCSGHGNDLWRAQGYYESSTGGSGTAYGPSINGVWRNCP